MDRMRLLEKAVAEKGQSAVARALGYSVSAINQVLHGKYRGSKDNVLQRVAEVFGTGKVICPVMGAIGLSRCAAERAKPFAATSPQRVRLFIACRTCGAFKRRRQP
jgi:transcriptional regulator with XRE-family HTH domain